MASQYTQNYNLRLPDPDDFVDIGELNQNFEQIDAALNAHDDQLTPVQAKEEPVDEDSFVLTDSAASGRKKILTFTALKKSLGKAFSALKHTHAIGDVTELSTALSNKARLYRSFEELGLTEATATIANILDAMENYSILVVGCGMEAENSGLVPWASGLLRVTKYRISYAMFEYQLISFQARLWRGYYNGGVTTIENWSGWKQIATAEPPQEYNVSFASGFVDRGLAGGREYSSKYSKDQFGRVHLQISVQGDPYGDVIKGAVIATLPAGFRPIGTAQAPIAALTSTGATHANFLVRPNGEIAISTSAPASFAHGQITFATVP